MDRPATSEILADMLRTNPAVVRRTMAGLREAGIVASVKGHGGGWSLVRPLTGITLMEIYDALGAPPLHAIGNDEETPACKLARAANDATDAALEASRREFEAQLRRVSVADLVASI